MHKIQIRSGDEGQSSIVGYALTLGMCAMILISSTFLVGNYMDERYESAAKIQAQSIANNIANSILEAANVKQMTPTGSYEKNMELPDKIATYNYYIELDNGIIYVKSANGKISESSTVYKATEIDGQDLSVESKKIWPAQYGSIVVSVSSDNPTEGSVEIKINPALY